MKIMIHKPIIEHKPIRTIEVRLDEDTVWLTQAQIATLFGLTKH